MVNYSLSGARVVAAAAPRYPAGKTEQMTRGRHAIHPDDPASLRAPRLGVGASPRRRSARTPAAAPRRSCRRSRRAGARRRGGGVPRRRSAPRSPALPDGERAAIDGFFAARGYAPFWTEPGSARAAELIAALERAPATRRCRPAATTPRALGAARAPRAPAPARARWRRRAPISPSPAICRRACSTPSAVDPEITRNPVRPPPAALLAPLASAPVAEALAGLRAGRPRLPPADRREGAARGAGADRELGAGGAGRPDAASRRQRPARRRAARAAGAARLLARRRRDASIRASTPALEAAVKRVPGATTA